MGATATLESEPFIPEEWQDKYSDLIVTKSDKFGGERLYGRDKETGKKRMIPWQVLVDAVQESYGESPIQWRDDQIEHYSNDLEAWKNHKETAASNSLTTQEVVTREKQRREQIIALEDRVAELERTNEELRLANGAFTRMLEERNTEVERMQARLEALERSIEEVREQARQKDEEIAGLQVRLGTAAPVPDHARQPQPARPATDTPHTPPAAAVADPAPRADTAPPPPDAPPTGDPTPAAATAPAVANTSPDAPVPAVPQLSRRERMRRRWHHSMGRLGDTLSGRRTLAALQARGADRGNRVIERDGERIAVYEEPIVEEVDYTERDIHRGEIALAVGAAALTGAGLLAAYFLTRHGAHDHANRITEIINQNKSLNGKVNKLQGQVSQLQGTLNHDTATINQMQGQINHDTSLLNKMSLQLTKLKQNLSPPKGPSGGGGGTIKQSFNVAPGSGIVREVQDYGRRAGKNLSGNHAYHIYQQLRAHFGSRIINLAGTRHDTYTAGSDLRLSQPGSAHWFPAAGKMLARLVNRGG